MSGDYELDILQWGKGEENYRITLSNVSEIYEPEQDKGIVTYKDSKFSEIPEWLFSKKVTSREMSRFYRCERITSIPENLFKNCVNVKEFDNTFTECRGLTSIPENLFKYNVNVTQFYYTFYICRGLTSIPENLFKYNVNVKDFSGTFSSSSGLLYIPNTIIEHAKRVKEEGGNVRGMFNSCTKASNYNSLPAYMKNY